MHRSSSCSCDHHHYQPNSFSMLFTMPPYHQNDMCPYDSSSSSSSASVDCTLSLATPAAAAAATCLTEDYDLPESRSSSRFCWDFLQPENTQLSTAPTSHRSNRGGATNSAAADSLLARRCANCDTTSTPLWRNGPRGPKSLCNACGIRFKKEERRAATVVGAGGGDVTTEGYNQNSWAHKLPSCYSPAAVGSEYRFRDEVDDRDSTFLSWRLNVTDRPGLVHDFTRY